MTITTGLVGTHSTPLLLRTPAAGQLPSSELITYRFELGRMEEAYDVFSRAVDTGVLRVVPGGPRHGAACRAARAPKGRVHHRTGPFM